MKKGLGRGLSALLPPEKEESGQTTLKITQLEPNKDQPRKTFDKEKLQELSDSIRLHGVLQPILVKAVEDGFFMIVAGERRYRAARMAGLSEVPVMICDHDEKAIAEISLIENLQREDLNPVEEATGYRQLLEQYKMTQEQISERVGKSRSAIANAMRILGLAAPVLKLVREQEISAGHGRALLAIEDASMQEEIAYQIIEKDLSVRQVENLAAQMKKEKKLQAVSAINIAAIDLSKRLSEVLGTKAKVSSGAKKGKIEIEFYDTDTLDKIVDLLTK